MKRWLGSAFAVALASAIAGCGGGSGGDTLAEGGIGGTGISSGSISAFGSIVVNGTRFDVEAAAITVNGEPATQAGLEVGQVVRVEGDLDEGTARTVAFEADLIGEVDANPIAAGQDTGTLTVLQQTVRVTATTVLDDVAEPAQLTSGQRVLVSGFRNAAGELVATFLGLAGGGARDQIVGTVTGETGTGFEIGNLDVVTLEEPDVGDRVLLRGDYDPSLPQFAADVLIRVELDDADGTEIELEGIVDGFDSATDFTVGGVPVDAASAAIEGGTPALNAEVEVEGLFDGAGVLVAERVEVELDENVEITARVAAVDAGAATVGFFNAGGALVTAEITPTTRLRDNSGLEVEPFALADLLPGQWVELDASERDGGSVVALQLERIDPQDQVELEAPIDAIEELLARLVVLGMSFDTGAADLSVFSEGDVVELSWARDATFVQPDMPVDELEQED